MRGGVTSTAYKTITRPGPLPLKAPKPTVPEVANLCLQHLAENPEQLAEFMNTSGLTPGGLRAAIGSADFNRGLLDYFASNEPLLLAFCAATGLTPDSVMQVWAKLNPAN